MAKDKKKKNNNKALKEEKKAKAAVKQAKKEKKGKSKNQEEDSDEDIEAILANFQREQLEKFKVAEEIVGEAPSFRGNATLTPNPLPNANELIFFGGEYYDGARCTFYNELFRYNVEKNEWKKITSPNSPGPRSSHQMVATPNGTMFLYGGEFASANETKFFHYRDFWSFDLKSSEWTKQEIKPLPPPRSGHRMTLWKHYLVLFGGFYDNVQTTRYYDDLWLFDTLEYKWIKVEFPENSNRPSPRSGFQLFPHGDNVFLYGGYCREFVKGGDAKGIVHSDLWMLKMNADPKLIRWERRKRQGFAPSPRTGGTMVVYKNRATLFGGVYDEEVNDEKLETVCYNEMYTYQCDTNKWYPLSLRLPKTSKKKKKAKKVVEQSVEEEEKKMEYSDEEEDDNENNNWGATKENSHSEDPSNEPDEPEKPSPRYNAMMCVVKNHLYLYGGILEVGDREFTLDDFYSLNLDKLHEFVCIKKPNIEAQVWLGENSDDDDDDDDDEDDEDDENDEEGARGDDEAAEKPSKTKEPSGVAATGGLGRHGRIDRNALEELEAAEDTPKPGESLREFFERTNTYWVEKAYEETQRTGKALRRDGFQMAEERYIEFEPQLKEWEGILKEIEEREKREALEKKQQKEKSRR